MKIGLTKRQKNTHIFFDEQSCLTFEIKKGRLGFKLPLIARNAAKRQAHWQRKTGCNPGGKDMKNIISCKFNMGCVELLLGDSHLIKCIAFCVKICNNKYIITNLLSTEVNDGGYIFDEN